MSKLLQKLRQEALELTWHDYRKERTWKAAIMESIFRPKFPSIPNKGPMDMLHPDIDKLHLPPDCYIADWRKYKVEDHPMLVNFQKRCHASGLHDPWLRSICHDFYENLGGGFKSRTAAVTYQLTYGFAAAAVFYGSFKTYTYFYPIQFEHSPEYIEKWGPEGKPHH